MFKEARSNKTVEFKRWIVVFSEVDLSNRLFGTQN